MSSIIRKSFQTQYTAIEMKGYIEANILSRSELSALLDSTVWNGLTLNITSKIGNGTITLSDYRIDVEIELSFFGSMARKQIEATLDNNFKSLEPPRKP
jgi:hypothetical protein